MEARSGTWRPYRSLTGPMNNCPSARPAMLVVIPIWTRGTVVPKKPVMAGRPGRYMSVTSGPKAARLPSVTIRNV